MTTTKHELRTYGLLLAAQRHAQPFPLSMVRSLGLAYAQHLDVAYGSHGENQKALCDLSFMGAIQRLSDGNGGVLYQAVPEVAERLLAKWKPDLDPELADLLS